VLLHYLWKIKISNLLQIWKQIQTTFFLSLHNVVANFHFALFIIIIIINIYIFLGAHVSAVSLPLSPACTLRLTAALI